MRLLLLALLLASCRSDARPDWIGITRTEGPARHEANAVELGWDLAPRQVELAEPRYTEPPPSDRSRGTEHRLVEIEGRLNRMAERMEDVDSAGRDGRAELMKLLGDHEHPAPDDQEPFDKYAETVIGLYLLVRGGGWVRQRRAAGRAQELAES